MNQNLTKQQAIEKAKKARYVDPLYDKAWKRLFGREDMKDCSRDKHVVKNWAFSTTC